MAPALLSLGNATHQIPADPLRETGLSQVFVAVNLVAVNPAAVGAGSDEVVDGIIQSLHSCNPRNTVRYPGERTLEIRAENRRLGLPVEEEVWAEITAFGGL